MLTRCEVLVSRGQSRARLVWLTPGGMSAGVSVRWGVFWWNGFGMQTLIALSCHCVVPPCGEVTLV